MTSEEALAIVLAKYPEASVMLYGEDSYYIMSGEERVDGWAGAPGPTPG